MELPKRHLKQGKGTISLPMGLYGEHLKHLNAGQILHLKMNLVRRDRLSVFMTKTFFQRHLRGLSITALAYLAEQWRDLDDKVFGLIGDEYTKRGALPPA